MTDLCTIFAKTALYERRVVREFRSKPAGSRNRRVSSMRRVAFPLRKFIMFACVAFGLMAFVGPSAWANTQRTETMLETGPVVRHQMLYRSGRLELAPYAGVSLDDAFFRNVLAGATLSYHLTNTVSIGATAGYGVAQMETDLSRNLKIILAEENPQLLQNVSFAQTSWLVDLGLAYVPLSGKFSMFNRAVFDFDIHLMGGVAIVGEKAVAGIETGQIDPRLEGIRPGGMAGIGMRLFLGDMFSLNVEVRDYIYSRAQVSKGTANPQLSNNFTVAVGLGIFIPGSTRISR